MPDAEARSEMIVAGFFFFCALCVFSWLILRSNSDCRERAQKPQRFFGKTLLAARCPICFREFGRVYGELALGRHGLFRV
jgi:hypothetical protein